MLPIKQNTLLLLLALIGGVICQLQPTTTTAPLLQSETPTTSTALRVSQTTSAELPPATTTPEAVPETTAVTKSPTHLTTSDQQPETTRNAVVHPTTTAKHTTASHKLPVNPANQHTSTTSAVAPPAPPAPPPVGGGGGSPQTIKPGPPDVSTAMKGQGDGILEYGSCMVLESECFDKCTNGIYSMTCIDGGLCLCQGDNNSGLTDEVSASNESSGAVWIYGVSVIVVVTAITTAFV